MNNQLVKTVLVVDDHPNNIKLLIKYLQDSKYKVLVAQGGKKAIKIACSVRPSLILLDVMMPEIDGFETCSQLKINPDTQDIPIIFMTALAETVNKVKGFELGAVDYITKPIEKEELLARVKTHISLQDFNQHLIRDRLKQKLLFETSDRIRQSLDLESTLKTATDEIRDFFNCDLVGLIQLRDNMLSVQGYSLAAGINIDFANILPWKYIYGDRNSEHQSYLQGNVRVVAEENFLKPINQLFSRPLQTRLIAPIITNSTQSRDFRRVESDLWGWLILDQYQSPRQWQTDEIDLLKVLTNQLAIGIKQGQLYEKLSQQAFLDPLTGISNRRHLDRQLELEWRRLQRISAPLSLVMCDVDCFKFYNDTYGHKRGDECLQEVARAISTVMKRPGDVLARYGGEEFTVILPQTPQFGAIKVAEAMRVAVKKLGIAHSNSTVDSVVTISLGVASTIPNSEDDPQLLIEAADLALYKAKERGRNCVAVYPEPISKSKNRQDLEAHWVKRLRRALENNLFSLYAQPITPLETNDSKRYFEILLRLTDEREQVITPNNFLAVANRNCLMPEIDTWVINNLLETLAAHHDSNHWQNHRFAINLSGASLNQESFLDFLAQKLTDYHLPSDLFCFEITETVAVSEITRVARFIKSLKTLGCSFALDDFGKGMSSLTYLKNLPVDYLKIDGSFIKEVNENKSSKVMVEAISHIAEGIGLKTVAEFVENQHILDTVKNLKIDYAQGFHLGRPGALMTVIDS